MSKEERQKFRKDMKQVSPEDRRELQRRLKDMFGDERKALRQKWRGMSPQDRRDFIRNKREGRALQQTDRQSRTRNKVPQRNNQR